MSKTAQRITARARVKKNGVKPNAGPGPSHAAQTAARAANKKAAKLAVLEAKKAKAAAAAAASAMSVEGGE
eukprot:CAMPEP_0204564394 /NCGR_PEP_ID=MMETSP0661-20131031/34861_1 /ASSEMBLY_ACC=CAM_ASM_000606 /TAXON_ID=109239 /ORGANISM="Alexandrium margalefi, Strain AMGDE01CS-322" /LENGTH=70 /DNA_ID=CAMNT_0051572033 /DNA_START=73 /DNA_END=285 /DNA_ORIENTATION=+